MQRGGGGLLTGEILTNSYIMLENILSSIDLTKIEIYIVGDINIDFKDKKHTSTKKLNNFIKPYGLNQIIKKNPKTRIV